MLATPINLSLRCNLVIDQTYFELLEVGTYTFKAVGASSSYEFTVQVTAVSTTVLQDLQLEQGCNAVVYLGNVKVESVSVNGTQLGAEQFKVENFTLTIDSSLLTEQTNTIVINGQHTVTVTIVSNS